MTANPEHGLVERCRHGDESAFRELVDHYKVLVFALVSRSISDRARAEEIAQDVFLKVHRGLPYFRGESKLSTWIYRIAVNAISQEKKEPPGVSLDAPALDGRKPLVLPVEDRQFRDFALRQRLDKAIERLPVNYQVLIHGHYLKGMQYEELAEALDLPIGTVKTHLHRAKRRLRELLETEFR